MSGELPAEVRQAAVDALDASLRDPGCDMGQAADRVARAVLRPLLDELTTELLATGDQSDVWIGAWIRDRFRGFGMEDGRG